MNAAVTDDPVSQILIADDPCEWVKPVADALRRLDIRCHVARSNEQSLRIIRTEPLRLALIAADLPRLGGMVFVQKVHRLVQDLPVVLIGSRSDRYWLETALKLQARTILPRPVEVTLVLETIRRTLNVQTCGFDGPARINRD